MTVLAGPRIVTPDGVLADGHLRVDGATIESVCPARPAGEVQPVDGAWIVPGFVDIHTHGGGGYTFTTGDPEQAQGVARFHLAHGTTTLLASLVTSPPDLMVAATRAYAPLVDQGIIAGLHFEGPYLSHARCGAQNPAHLREPSTDELARLIGTGAGAVRMVTIAPELPGALEAIAYLVDHGVVVAIGHTDATYEQTLAGIAAGATVGTHVFNGMRPPHHREPGPVFALLGSDSVTCELIGDGVHLHDGALRFATTVTGASRAALITDAMAGAGMPDGEYELGGQGVTVSGGVARLTDGGSIAGSTLTMDVAFRRAVAAGLPVEEVARMAATTPAAAIGRTDIGALQPGRRADLVVLDAELRVLRVMRAGTWVA
ncbi:N-acetylglucosamine-6-phosphate deacetylase [Planosporangium mesophilum]|uniref:N-acetylglucosamine-6-phosphate deacetylase n=1 Tax=Planosporangium mesophilum TaxID=689768 RepID=A0A8J3X326_9ACTN|nr:N-acetylglucosamine-6-phosphate deacetylase [Planosporangium mesophilum]NJC83743.1 N-acetylglucosamine-6-phosphate deacetylase [Planosporangium mesophilum]GII26075.1 N-acetylglucosamine-6-phosphate deacetylase [Planosporangium mesophilum]